MIDPRARAMLTLAVPAVVVGMAAALILLVVVLAAKLLQRFLWQTLPPMVGAAGTAWWWILGVLTLVDLSFTASLLIIVMFSGYENFVSKIDHSDHKDWPEWMGTIDFTGLKLKLMSSIVAISAISLLKAFMDVKSSSDRDLIWLVSIHMVFVVSGILMALTDRIAAGHHDK